ncbi:MAG: ABC transporter permease [Bacteroidales bacterium]|nr:ABC transporter permease [Bacteroidales bacterium]MDD3724146.1 ABC transporter permease [Bacteroidales bacterium]
MNFEYFISKRLSKQKGKTFSRPIIIIAILSISLGVAVMITSISVLQGFKSEIKEKIIGFGSHVQILPYQSYNSYDSQGISLSPEEEKTLRKHENIKSINPFISLGGLIKTKDDFQGVMLKGIDNNYDSNFFHNYLLSGRFLSKENINEAIISKHIANKLSLSLGDKLRIYFYIDNNYRARAMEVIGIYETGLSLYDEKIIICNIDQLRPLSSLKDNEVHGYEILLKDFSKQEESSEYIYNSTSHDKTILNIQEIEPNLFSWLNLLDSNVVVILLIMILVSIITITSTLLIIIFEKTQTIGILKSLGANNRSIIKIFLYNALNIIIKGILYGNIFALGLGYLQVRFKIFKLDQESYYLTSVPIEISFSQVMLVNLGTIIICFLALLIPARSISKISPIKSIRFD